MRVDRMLPICYDKCKVIRRHGVMVICEKPALQAAPGLIPSKAIFITAQQGRN